ncbi:MAG: hypothetical protein HC890_04065 [Chloroflexaceae bacterium]|nr:hypothetical protein [Chloroflexaceae bacterium]
MVKVNTTILLVLGLIGGMLAVSFASGAISHELGRQALKSVSQPDANPVHKFAEKPTSTPRKKAPPFVEERQILIKVYNRTHKAQKQSFQPRLPTSFSGVT